MIKQEQNRVPPETFCSFADTYCRDGTFRKTCFNNGHGRNLKLVIYAVFWIDTDPTLFMSICYICLLYF